MLRCGSYAKILVRFSIFKNIIFNFEYSWFKKIKPIFLISKTDFVIVFIERNICNAQFSDYLITICIGLRLDFPRNFQPL